MAGTYAGITIPPKAAYAVDRLSGTVGKGRIRISVEHTQRCEGYGQGCRVRPNCVRSRGTFCLGNNDASTYTAKFASSAHAVEVKLMLGCTMTVDPELVQTRHRSHRLVLSVTLRIPPSQ